MKLFFEKLHRGLIRVSGNEVHEFLQGLITNDIYHINNKSECDNAMFTMFLSKQGRVLYDTIIYKQRHEKTACLIECDRTIEKQLKQHLMCFRLRKNINIDIISHEVNIWSCFQDDHKFHGSLNLSPEQRHKYWDLDATVCYDPRHQLGLRVITSNNLKIQDFQDINDDKKCSLSTITHNYKKHRYIHGVSEGIIEIPPTKAFPFELNCDYLHGISFNKGCYLGQEFTARTYHTGVIRKRIMPLSLPGNVTDQSYNEPIVNEQGVTIGKLRGIQNEYGIGLLKTDLALSSKQLKIGNLKVFTYRPIWWPKKY